MPFDQEQEAVLNRFTTNNPDLEALEAKISRFNIFEAVGMVRQEIKHSNFIQFLLSPVEKHGLNDLFLKKLLTEVLRVSEDGYLGSLSPTAMKFTDADIRREWRHIDLLIHSPSNSFVCVIENKVDSTEGSNQLQTYQSVIDFEFPRCEKLFIYLTKEGDRASCSDWLPLSYGSIADIIEKICEERQSTFSPDIEISMRHYVDLIRRHLMRESDIAELCRKIYKQHRQAIDLIYEHRPDMRSDIQQCIEQIIQGSIQPENLINDSVYRQWIRFAPQEWDELAFQKTCVGWSASKRILLFEFWNEPQSLRLHLTAGPGELQIKQAIYQKLKELSIQGLKKCKIRDSGWSQMCIIEVLKPSDYEEGNLEELQEKIQVFWRTYINRDLKVIRKAIYEAFQDQG